MSNFATDAENNVTAFTASQDAVQAAGENGIHFYSQATLASASADWPIERFVEIWNGIPGHEEVTTFKNRKQAVSRIWKAVQQFAKDEEPAAKEAKGGRKAAKKAKTAAKPKAAKKAGKVKKAAPKKPGNASDRTNKKAEVIAMMKRGKGVTLAEIMKETGWQAHTVRGFVSILGSKGGETVESTKNAAGERTYRIGK